MNKFNKIKSFSIIIVPDEGGSETKSHKLNVGKIASLITIYTIVVAVLGFIFFAVTGIGNFMLPGQSGLTREDMSKINEVNQRIIYLSRELENLKTTNKQLKDAIMMGDSTLIDSLKLIKNGQSDISTKAGGDLFFIIKKIFGADSENQSQTVLFTKPVNGFVSRGFNPENGHFGIDFVVKTGTPVFAAASGYVVFSGFTVNDGNMLIIINPDDYITIYKHCSVLLKKVRDEITEGEVIALSGNSGDSSTGPHLHFEVWKHGRPINPKSVFVN